MPVSSFVFTLAAVFSGLFAGAFLAYSSPEELRTGKKYFLLMQKALLILISIIAIANSEFPSIIAYPLYLAAALIFIFIKFRSIYTYPFISAVLLFFRGHPAGNAVFLALAGLSFLYGFPSGSLFAMASKGKRIKSLARLFALHSAFFAVPVLFYLIRSYF